MLKNEGSIVSQRERLHILRSILLQTFQYYKLDSTKYHKHVKLNLFNSLWL